ncbi:MAG: rhodanese-like domain-containing protein [Verrucomicrobia bacterium]|nr:MAG: rhodanese-like domain-containing protein [Verrucomicrobiota bacterium]
MKSSATDRAIIVWKSCLLGASAIVFLSFQRCAAQTTATNRVSASASAVAIVQSVPSTNQPALEPKSPDEPNIPALTWPQVKTLLAEKKILLIDARPKPNYDIGHIPGAINLPGTSSVEELRDFAVKHPKDEALVLYCGSEHCHTSHQLAVVLVKIFGYTNVRDLPGGMVEFLNSGLDAVPEKVEPAKN